MTTTLGQATGSGGYGLHRRASIGETGTAVRSTSISLGMVGFVALVVSAWGGIVPFVGPTFGFSADGAASWHWQLSHVVLGLIPGALGCLVGLTLLAPANATVTRRRLSLSTAGVIGIASGAWFVIGPLAWPVLVNTHSYFLTLATPLRELEYQVGYALGPGLILVMCSAFAVGWAARHNRPLEAVGAARDVPGMAEPGPALVPEPTITPQPIPPEPEGVAQPAAPQPQPPAPAQPAAQPAPQAQPATQPTVAPEAQAQDLATESEVFGNAPRRVAGDPAAASPAEPAAGSEPPVP
jgi:hypothetical protein